MRRIAVVAALLSALYAGIFSEGAFAQDMEATYYGPGFEGLPTSSGEIFDSSLYTAAHAYYPFGTVLTVCYEGCVDVVVNDRPGGGTDLDLSTAAGGAIGMLDEGRAIVDVEPAA